jgi:hypothetical protein
MDSTGRLTRHLVAAPRVLTSVSQSELAMASGISLEMLHLLESSGPPESPTMNHKRARSGLRDIRRGYRP